MDVEQTEVELVRPRHSTEWTVQFANPLLRDARDESVVVRRTLDTTDQEEALEFLEELELLLRSTSFEDVSPSELRDDYADIVVDAVFGGADEQVDYEARRSDVSKK